MSNEFKEEHLMSAFKRVVMELKEAHMIVDSKFEIDGNKIKIIIKADNEPR